MHDSDEAGGGMTERRTYSRHGLNAPMARVKLRGFTAIDRRTAAARTVMAFRRELVSALGGEADLSPQRRKLVDMASRAALLLDHIDGWIMAQPSVINRRSRAVLPVVIQRQGLADHLAKLLDRLGLDRVPQRVPSLTDYIAQRGAPQEAPGSTTANPATGANDAGADDDGTEGRPMTGGRA